jgi:hypothetical protein
MSFNKQMSLFIPSMGVLNDKGEISRLFHSLDIGRVSNIKFYPKTDKIGKFYNSANIYFAEWYDTETARSLQASIKNATREKPARMIYSDPLDWILLENTRLQQSQPVQPPQPPQPVQPVQPPQPPLHLQHLLHDKHQIQQSRVYDVSEWSGFVSHQDRQNDFEREDYQSAVFDDDEEEYYDQELMSLPLVRQKTPLIQSVYNDDYETAVGLELELDEARKENQSLEQENESLQKDIKTIIDELDSEHQIQLLIQLEQIVNLEKRVAELEARNRHLEEVNSFMLEQSDFEIKCVNSGM